MKLDYRKDIMGAYIDAWYVIEDNSGMGQKWHYKTEAAAVKKYDSLDHALLVRETTVAGQDVTIAVK